MKKLVIFMLCAAFAVSLAACGDGKVPMPKTPASPTDIKTTVVNPVSQATSETVLSELGLDLSSCDTLDNVYYNIIDGSPKLAEVHFMMDDHAYTYRVAPTAEEQDISGMYFTWDSETKADVGYCKATVCTLNNGIGVIRWFDAAPGIMYTLTMDDGATAELLTATANKLFEPVQGDSDGEADAYMTILTAYAAAASEGLGREELEAADLNGLLNDCGVDALEGIGFSAADLDGDGTDELLIGVIDGNDFTGCMMLDLYTKDENGSAVRVFRTGERDRYYYAGENLFANVGSNSADDSIDTTVAYENGGLTDLGSVTEEYVQAELTPLSAFVG